MKVRRSQAQGPDVNPAHLINTTLNQVKVQSVETVILVVGNHFTFQQVAPIFPSGITIAFKPEITPTTYNTTEKFVHTPTYS